MRIIKMMLNVSAVLLVAGCGGKKSDFKYTVDQFADVKVIL